MAFERSWMRMVQLPKARRLLMIRCLLQRHIASRTPTKYASFSEVLQLHEKQFMSIVFPLQDLARFLAPNVDTSCFQIFNPNHDDISRAEMFFVPSHRHVIDYSTSAVRMDHVPQSSKPEVRSLKVWFMPIRVIGVHLYEKSQEISANKSSLNHLLAFSADHSWVRANEAAEIMTEQSFSMVNLSTEAKVSPGSNSVHLYLGMQ